MVEPDECLEGAPSLLLAVCHAMASLNSFGPSSPPQPYMNEIRNNTGKYACAVTALFMIAGNTVCNNNFLINCSNWYNQIPDWNEYSVIWDATETTVIQNSNSSASSAVQLGITKDDKIGPGFVDYCKGKSFNLSESHWRSPTFQQYISQVSNIQHSVFTARIKSPQER